MRISDWSSDVCSSDLTAHRDEVVGRIDGHRIAVLPQVIGIALAAAALGALVERRGLGRIGGLGLAERQEQQAEECDQSKHGTGPFAGRFWGGAPIRTPPRRGL